MNCAPHDRVLAVLAHHIGRERGINVSMLASEVQRSVDQDLHQEGSSIIHPEAVVTERAIRAAVSELRLKGHHICAHPQDGYYIAHTPEELNDTCRFLVERAMTSLVQVAAMKRVSLPDLYGQMGIPLEPQS